MKLKQIPKTDLDYVEIYARELKNNSKFFKQQKKLIESQLKSSSQLAKQRFPSKNFKISMRNHLRKIGLLKP
jgi:hypothetical protein